MRRVVVKIGSRVIANDDGLSSQRIADLARQLADVAKGGVEVVVVSSGAIACGWPRLGLRERPRTLPMLQAAAAAGQSLLMRSWEDAFAAHDLACAQILVTHGDVADRRRFLNAKETLDALLAHGVIPIVNENDTIATEEIQFGDNDNLSADVSLLVGADLLLLLTEVAGLMTADPNLDPEAVLISEVRDIETEAAPVAGPGTGNFGTGGMISKVDAARKATAGGTAVVVASGLQVDTVIRVLADESVGTRFFASEDRLRARKHWIAYTLKPQGTLVVDAGARAALVERGKSLLPSGVREVKGDFDRGDAVRVADADGVEFARGLVDYSADEMRSISGKRSEEIEPLLGYSYGDEAIHRDDLAVIDDSQ